MKLPVGINKDFMKPLVRAAIILLFMDMNRLLSGPPWQITLNLLIWVSFLFISLFQRSWWTIPRLAAAAIAIIAECAAALLLFQEWKLLYFVAIMTFAAAIHLSLARSQVPAVAAMLAVTLLYIRFGREDLFQFLTFSLLAVVFYWSVRSRMQRNDLHEQNKSHLAKLQKAYDQLQEASAVAMNNAVLEERTRIARDIHDAVGHSLTSLIVQMQALRYMIKQDTGQAERSVDEMLAVARQGLQNIRTSVHALADDRTPSGVTPLHALLSRMEASASVSYTLKSGLEDGEADADVSGLLFNVLQEAVTNVIRHSGATHVDVELGSQSGVIVMIVRDDGTLMPGDKLEEGFGLRTMKARIEEKGGRLQTTVLHPHGLELRLTVPTANSAVPVNEGGGRNRTKEDSINGRAKN